MKQIKVPLYEFDSNDSGKFLISHAMCEEIEKVFERLTSEQFVDSARNATDEKKLMDRYAAQFSGVSKKMELWASQRRLVLRKVEKAVNDLKHIKSYTSKGKVVFSAVDIIGTTTSIILEQLQMDMASKVRYISAAFGCFSFICSLFEISKKSFIMEDILKELRNDSELLFETQKILQKLSDFDRSIQNFFPHGIDIRIVKLIQQKGMRKREQKNEKKNDSQIFIEKLSSSTNVSAQVTVAILVTNIRMDPTLLDDAEFLEKVKVFSKSPLGELWWNRVKYQGLLPVAQKSRLLTELNSQSRIESMPIRTFPLLSSPMWHLKGMPTAGSIVLNSLVVFDSYCELTQGSKTSENDLLEDLKFVLEAEYKNIKDTYQKLSLDSD
ncbi:uncharacterized protein NPIL_108951 [Nephila pilipes]|uniref:Uncharacterized protein n=1 Tax=Nephila pilipes TaxID=299642 RepID=A0A8X6MQ70_NEPPI|nr:uncharacterized protein NPIL_108951 [Nephila pilipes]